MTDKQDMIEFVQAAKQVLQVIEMMVADWSSHEQDADFQQAGDDALYNGIRSEPFEFKMTGVSSDGHPFRVEFRMIDTERDTEDEEEA